MTSPRYYDTIAIAADAASAAQTRIAAPSATAAAAAAKAARAASSAVGRGLHCRPATAAAITANITVGRVSIDPRRWGWPARASGPPCSNGARIGCATRRRLNSRRDITCAAAGAAAAAAKYRPTASGLSRR